MLASQVIPGAVAKAGPRPRVGCAPRLLAALSPVVHCQGHPAKPTRALLTAALARLGLAAVPASATDHEN